MTTNVCANFDKLTSEHRWKNRQSLSCSYSWWSDISEVTEIRASEGVISEVVNLVIYFLMLLPFKKKL